MLKELKALIAANKTREVLTKMAQIIGDKDATLLNRIILISSQIANNESQFSMRLTDIGDYNQTAALTTKAILATLDELGEEGYFDNVAEIEQKMATEVKVDNRTKIQFLAANPSSLNKLQLEREYIEIRKIFKFHQDKFALTEEFDVTLESFFEAIYTQKPKIVHFSGLSDTGEHPSLIFNRKNGSYQCVSFEYLSATFKLFRDSVECVFINTAFSDIFAKVVSRFIPNVIGVKEIINDKEAITFASGFYTALSFDKNYQNAFHKAKDLLLAERFKVVPPTLEKIPTSYGIGKLPRKLTQEDLENEEEKKKYIPYVMFSNGEAVHENDTTPDDFPQQEKQEKKR